MSEKLCIHCYITGRVQGVWFRASTQEQAKALGVTGWARNLPDGRVEVLAAGAREQVAALHRWLQQGPMLAKVEEVSYQELPWQAFDRFSIR